MRKIIFFCFVLLHHCYYSQSPITLGNSNMPGNNDTLRYTNVQLTSLGNYTQTGTNFSWNFNNVVSLTEGVRSFKNAFQTPYAFYFLQLNEYGEKIADTLGVGPMAITQYYNFYRKMNNPPSFIADGVGMTFNNLPFPSYYSDKDELYFFPMSYPKYDSSSFRFSSITTSLIPVSYSKTGYRVTKVDGWGMISTPNGTANCLRLVTTQYGKDTIKLGFFPVGLPNVQRSYQWMTTTSKIPYLEITGSLLGNNFTPTLARYRGYNKLSPTGINENISERSISIFPNPTSGEITVDGDNIKNIQVVDVYGRVVFISALGAATLDISSLSPGIYTAVIQSDRGIDRVKFFKQ